jgi:hypothetical protein
MFSVEEVRALGDCLNVTWGKSVDNLKLSHKFNGDLLELRFDSIVHFAGERALESQMTNLREMSNDIFSDGVKKIKSDFKDAIGRALKTSELSRDDSVELIQATSNSPRKVAYYRAFLTLQVS